MTTGDQYIFISYKTEERALAQRIRTFLAISAKCDVWWDQNLQTGGQWSSALDQALREASCVVVIWSAASVLSPWVQQEAAVAKALGKLVPIRVDGCQIPGPYLETQTANLHAWNGQEDDAEFVKVTKAVGGHLRPRTRMQQTSATWRMMRLVTAACAGMAMVIAGIFMWSRTEVPLAEATRDEVQNLRLLTLQIQACATSPIPDSSRCDTLAREMSTSLARLEKRISIQSGR